MRSLHLTGVDARRRPLPGTERTLPADLVLLALGFSGPDRADGLADQLGVELEPRGTIARDGGVRDERARCVRRRGRGARAVAHRVGDRGGRAVAAAVDAHLHGVPSPLPAPIGPYDRPMTV
ncbi:glutamate synthase (NADPH) OS=Streptomyces fumanus OX=67302 GN=GCM10018772_65800 PE=4 SV=1 [Streptomyces fumanus]